MYLIVGLGNPGSEYNNTRHNVGFDFIDFISEKYNIPVNRIKFKGVCGEGFISNKKVVLLKPNTYMNLSGESVREALNFYKLDGKDLLVIYDDISLEVGRLRIREKGSAGGHNGIKNIILNLSSDVFPRIKIGVGEPKGNLVSHVLGKIPSEDRKKLDEVLIAGSQALELMLKEDLTEAMNKFNGFKAEI